MALLQKSASQGCSALLSAVDVENFPSDNDLIEDSGALSLFGEPIIATQIERLRKLGIVKFWVEIDVVTGSTIASVDKFRRNGLDINFVRSPQELAEKISKDERIFVQSAGILADRALLEQILTSKTPIIATIDSRDENDRFERIDLNNRWAGLALFDPTTVAGISDLPAGWNIGSSLLRQALQEHVRQTQLRQSLVKNGQLRLITTVQEADEYANSLLGDRTATAYGAVESIIFRPFISRFVPVIWGMKSGKLGLDLGAGFFAATGLAAAIWQWPILSPILAMVTIFLLGTRFALQRADEYHIGILTPILWIMTASILLALHWKAGYGQMGEIFPALVLIGLSVHMRRFRQSGWRKYFEVSPAFICFIMIIATYLDRVIIAGMLTAIMQLSLLPFYQINSQSEE